MVSMATVIFFNSKKGYGYARIDHQNDRLRFEDVYFHVKQGVYPTDEQGQVGLSRISEHNYERLRLPKVGDDIVLENDSSDANQGRGETYWTYAGLWKELEDSATDPWVEYRIIRNHDGTDMVLTPPMNPRSCLSHLRLDAERIIAGWKRSSWDFSIYRIEYRLPNTSDWVSLNWANPGKPRAI